jgi:molybdate/tungstate transport system permease protein
VAWYLARSAGHDRIVWEAAVLISVLMPPLALGILLSLAFGPQTAIGGWLLRIGVPTSNSPVAFAATQVYVSIGYYILAARAALAAVPRELELTAALLGSRPLPVFRRVTFPLAKLGLGAALSLAWVRALGEFGAVVVTAYYPSGMPVQIWVNLQDAGMPAVMPLLVVFLLTALPLPWLIHLLAQKRTANA